MVYEIQQDLDSGIKCASDTSLPVKRLVDKYKQAYKAKEIAPTTELKYKADLEKLKAYCDKEDIRFARHFTENHLCLYRKWLKEQGYADKTVEGAVVLAKQMFKWAWRQRILGNYRFSAISFPKAKAAPQPCFTSKQVDSLISIAKREDRLAFALMGYAGLRIGEVEQLRWDDLHTRNNCFTMIHVRRGGSSGIPKDREDRFVPVHPKITDLLGQNMQKTGLVFQTISERQLLKRIKMLSKECRFENPKQYKLHSFRHHFASYCANNNVPYRMALAWLGHSSSQMLDLYYHLHDQDSQRAMMALAKTDQFTPNNKMQTSTFKGNMRAMGQSKIEKTLQVPAVRELVASLSDTTERAGFEPAVGTSPTQPFQGCSISHSDTSPN